MRNSEGLAVIKAVFDNTGNVEINRTTQLDGVINGITGWADIHRALSVLIGYSENGREVPGLLRPKNNTTYFQDLISRFPPSTDNFPGDLFNSLQRQIDSITEDIPIIIHTLEQMSPEPSDSALTLEFSGTLSLEEFQTTVSEIGRVIDLLKIENEVTQVWTDFGSTVFGLEVATSVALLVLNATMSGAEQFREFIAGFTPEGIRTYFRMFNHISQSLLGAPLDERLSQSDETAHAIRNFAGAEVTVGLTQEVTNEQINGIKSAIPQIAEMTDRGWNISCSAPKIEGSQITHSTFILANTVYVALPPAPNAEGEVATGHVQGDAESDEAEDVPTEGAEGHEG